MEGKGIIIKVLHLLTDKFISVFDAYIEIHKVDRSKVYIELLKRRIDVSHGIGSVAKNILTSYQLNGMSLSSDVIEQKVQHLVESIVLQDLLECALNSEMSYEKTIISSDDLHKIIFTCSLKDVAPDLSPSMNEVPNLALGINELSNHTLQSALSSYSSDMVNNNYPSMSAEFEISVKLFEEDLTHKKAENIGFGNSGMKASDIASKFYNERVDAQRQSVTLNCLSSPTVEKSFGDWLLSSYLSSAKDSIEYPDSCLHVLSWENKMKQHVPCHLYSTELTEKEATFNINDEDSQLFRSLSETSSVLEENNFILDVLDLLVGVPSPTFCYDEMKGKFMLKPFMHLLNLSHESTSKFCDRFIECGTLFYKLKAFSSEQSLQKSLILQGLQNGVKEIISMFMMYIVAVKSNQPDMQILKGDVLENAQLLITLGKICGVQFNQNIPLEFSKGLILLSSISSTAWACKNKDNVIMITVLLKHVFSPYFNYLNKWLEEGYCYDPFDEFQIIEDFKYLERRDELYWKFTYTENEDDTTRLIPEEIKKYSHDILQCGKSMRLLQDCCPQLFSLEYLSCNPPPSLSMVFSYHAVSQKKNQCNFYIEEKAEAEANYKKLGSDVSDDTFHIEKQKLVDRKALLHHIKRKWKFMTLHSHSSTDLYKSLSKERVCLKKSPSQLSLNVQKENYGFDCWNLEKVGLLFTCCGIQGQADCNPKSESSSKTSISVPKKFNLQLNLSSYCYSIPYSEPMQRKFQFLVKEKKSMVPDANSPTSEPEESYPANIPPGSFLDSLASLLVSEYKDSKEDINAFLKLISLQKMLEYNFSPVLNMRIHLVQRTIMDYIVNQLKLIDLLQCLRNTYFLQDESFNQSLCERLFLRALKSSNLHDFTDWIALNDILTRAVTVPSLSSASFLDTASVNFVNLPSKEVTERHLFFQYFQFEFKIEWPLNLIIHKACITQYTEMFSSIIEMEFLCWLLGKLWRLFHTDTRSSVEDSSVLESSPQYRKIMLNRFDMHQFIRVLHNCIHQDVGGSLWVFLLKSLNTEELSIDALEEIHCQYLEKALARCFLTEETTFLRDLLRLLFAQVYNFCEVALDCSWELNSTLNQYETSDFERLTSFYSSYKKCKDKFYDKIMQIVGRKKYKRTWDDEYPQFLEVLLETGRSS